MAKECEGSEKRHLGIKDVFGATQLG